MESNNVLYLGPGGINGFLELGFVVALDKYKILENFNVVCGSSIGSILAFLIALNLDIYTILSFCLEIKMDDFMINLDSLTTKTVFKLDLLKYKLVSIAEQVMGFIPNFNALYMFSGKDFRVPVYNITKRNMEIFNKETSPHLSCIDAILMSCSIPVFFPNFIYNGDCYIDPLVVNPYPIYFFDNNKDEILGIFVDINNEHEEDMFSKILDLLFLCPYEMSKMMKNNCSEKCKHAWLINDNKNFETFYEKSNIANLLINGYEQGKLFIENNYTIKNIEKKEEKIKDSVLKKIEIENDIFYENNHTEYTIFTKKKTSKNIIIPMTPRIKDILLDKNRL